MRSQGPGVEGGGQGAGIPALCLPAAWLQGHFLLLLALASSLHRVLRIPRVRGAESWKGPVECSGHSSYVVSTPTVVPTDPLPLRVAVY